MHWFWIWLVLFLVVTYGFMESYRTYTPHVARPLSFVNPTMPTDLKVSHDENQGSKEVPVTQWAPVVRDTASTQNHMKDLKKVRPLGFLQLENVPMNHEVDLELPLSGLSSQYEEAPHDRKIDVFEGYVRPTKKHRKNVWTSDVSETDESNGRRIVDVSASSQTSMLVHHYGPSVLKTRENPLVTRQRETLDDIEDLAARQGLSVDEFLAIRNQGSNVTQKDRDLKDRKSAMFRQEISQSYEAVSKGPLTNNLAEIAGLVRDCLQHVPTNNEPLAKIVLADILRARLEARELCVKVPQASQEHIDTLRYYQRSDDRVLADLAGQVLSRI